MKFYYFNSTHWDREWYQSFQVYRKYLIDVCGRLLEIYRDNPDFKFTFDGQTVVLEDIVELRPDYAPKLRELVTAGKLNVGPWYVMPDEFLVSGESLIRNLLIGKAVAREYGSEAWPVGYICDIFGHIAQMPQIAHKFGLDGLVVWRGVAESVGPYCLWYSPDGTGVKTLHLHPGDGYADFTVNALNWLALPLDKELFQSRFTDHCLKKKDYWGDHFVLSDAFDHSFATKQLKELFDWVREACPGVEIVHSDYTDLFREVFSAVVPERIHGEQIHPANRYQGWQISGTLSSRYDIKQYNDRLQDELELTVDPLTAVRSFNGDTGSNYLLKHAWKSLIKNHPHDSICGCSIDSVHRMMKCRFDDIAGVNQVIVEEFVILDRQRVTGRDFRSEAKASFLETTRAEEEAAADGCYTLRVYNPLPFAVNNMRRVRISFPSAVAYPKQQAEPFCYDFVNSFKLFDRDGNELPYTMVSVKRNQTKIFYRQDARKYDDYEIMVGLPLAASSWSSFALRPSATPVRYFDTLTVGQRAAANGILRLDFSADGCFDITDLRTGKQYLRQNDYRIDREIGDGWNHVGLTASHTVLSPASAQLKLRLDGSEYVEYEIVKIFEMPDAVLFEGTIHEKYQGIRESDRPAQMKITTRVGLAKNSDEVSVRTVIDNKIKDCRVRLMVPTGIAGEYFAGQQFYCNNRVPGRTWGDVSSAYLETEVVDKNFTGIIGKRGADGGIALLSLGGLHEAGALTDEDHSLAVTLLRAFRRTVNTNGETEGQLNQELHYGYVLKCFDGATTFAKLHNVACSHRAMLPEYLIKTAANNHLSTVPWLAFDENVLGFSAVKPAEDDPADCCIVRLFNPSDAGVATALSVARAVKAAVVSMAEVGETPLAIADGKLKLALGPWEVLTLKLWRQA